MSNLRVPSFLADEDVDARLVKFLLSKNVDIKYSDRGIRNSDLYKLACAEGRALLSLDKDFLNTSLFSPSKLPMIVVIRVHPLELSKLKLVLLHFLKNFSDNMLSKTLILEEAGIELAD